MKQNGLLPFEEGEALLEDYNIMHFLCHTG